MDIRAISAGRNPPKDIHVVIEIPLGGAPVKYELDKTSGALVVETAAPVDVGMRFAAPARPRRASDRGESTMAWLEVYP